MRTLKKTLSLVLVVAMVLGLCVVGASATNKVDGYEDAGKIGAAYTEAVGVMTGLGIVDGVTDTELRPENTYQRDQAAKIIAYMLLGKDKAEKLSCTKAPFEDVPANHWAAGYIAFCKDVGIIDGVTETEFKPTAALTGFQWAKMLLSAVGFGVNGELEGDEWSIKTHVFGNAVNLFDGDIAAATHNALQRQQAMLLAFNVLTDVNVVVWSEALGDYIEGYYTFADRYTYEGTLGENVWKLDSVTGVIVDNEGMGASATYVDSVVAADGNVKVVADTGLDMMYHAARVWYVEGTKANTGVYVKDLATVKNSSCGEMAKTPAGYTDKAIGNTITGAVDYEKSLVDNPAGYTDYAVTTYAYLSKIGNSSTAAKTTYIGTEKVNNDYIKTDISDIAKNVTVIVIRPSEKAFHVFATSATSGAVKGISSKGVIILTDGTTIAPSNLGTTDQDRINSIARIKTVLAGDRHETPTYYFTLDTHGHYITLTNAPFMTVAYFTGAKAYTGGTNDWWPDATYKAQFVDIETGEIEEIPVTSDWVKTAKAKGYYDITDELYGEKTYRPKQVFTNGNTYGLKYGYVGAETFSVNTPAANRVIDLGNGGKEVRYDNTTVFYVANYNGSKLVVDKYVGVDALVAGYAAKHNTTVSAVSFDNAAITYTKTAAGNLFAVTVFAYDTAIASGEYVFFPTTTTWSAMYDSYIEVDGYLNGTSKTGVFKFDKNDFGTSDKLERGFYEYSVDESGDYTYRRLTTQEFAYKMNDLDLTMDSGNVFFGKTPVSSDCLVVDTRKNLEELKIDAITDVPTLIAADTWANDSQYGKFAVAYVPAKEITVIYVVDFNLGLADFALDAALSTAGWTVDHDAYENEYVYFKNSALANVEEGTQLKISGTISYNGSTTTTTFTDKVATVVKDGTTNVARIAVSNITGVVFGTAKVTVNSIVQEVVLTNANTNFAGYYTTATVSAPASITADGVTLRLSVGDKINLNYNNTKVAENTYATATYKNGTKTVTASGTFDDAGGFWIVNVVPGKNTIELGDVSATYKFEITGNDIASWGFNNSGDNDSWTVTTTPGVKITVSMKNVEGADALAAKGNKHVSFDFGGETFTCPTAASEVASTGVFVFSDVIPGAVTVENNVNVVEVNGGDWDVDPETPAAP